MEKCHVRSQVAMGGLVRLWCYSTYINTTSAAAVGLRAEARHEYPEPHGSSPMQPNPGLAARCREWEGPNAPGPAAHINP